jgi:predicted metal-binding protein
MSAKNKVEITESDLKSILGNDFLDFEKKVISNVYCGNCDSPYSSTTINYHIFLNDLNDIILEGFCKKCGHPVSRYVEAGEVTKYQERIAKIKKLLKP